MLTGKPSIVIAKPPRRIGREPVALARIVVGAETDTTTEDEHRKAGEAADRLWQEIKRRVAEQR